MYDVASVCFVDYIVFFFTLLLDMIVLWLCTVGNWRFFPSLAFLCCLIESFCVNGESE